MKSLKNRALIGLALLLVLFVSCASNDYSPIKKAKAFAYPDANFAVISDLHLYSNELGTEGKAFEEYLLNDRKMLAQTEELLDVAIDKIIASGVKFVLIPGDLSKDGEEINHLLAVKKLRKLEDAGIACYVVPGNHDIKNSHSFRYSKDGKERVANITAERFAELYADEGYSEAIDRDPNSLAYVAEPVPGLWLLALDACLYRDNTEDKAPIVKGEFSQKQIDWIRATLDKAQAQGKAVMVMMHHGVVEHYETQSTTFGEYVVKDWLKVSEMFARSGVRVAFTGHFHAHDVTEQRFGENWIVDMETGSLASYSSPIRFVSFSGGKAIVRTTDITQLPSFAAQGKDFLEFSIKATEESLSSIAIKTMLGLGISREEAEKLTGYISAAFMAHYHGDEIFVGDDPMPTAGLSFMGGIVINAKKPLVVALWKDLQPADRDVDIDLVSGAATNRAK